MRLADKEILDFVRENITIVKDMTGHIVIKEVPVSYTHLTLPTKRIV